MDNDFVNAVSGQELQTNVYRDLTYINLQLLQVSLVRPKVTTSVHYCPATSKSLERHYSDLTSLDAYPSSAAYPTQDEDGNP